MPVAVNQTRPAEVDGLRRRLGFWLRNDAARLLWPTRCLACGEPGGEAWDLCPARADFCIWNAAHPRELAYWFGRNPLRQVVVGGRPRA